MTRLSQLLAAHLTSMPGVVLAGGVLMGLAEWEAALRKEGADDAQVALARMGMLMGGRVLLRGAQAIEAAERASAHEAGDREGSKVR